MKKRILIVDDSYLMREMLRDILAYHGYEVAGEAENGSEAIELYKELKPDLVTMDITMPGLDGIETVKGILSIDPDANIVMVSSAGHDEQVRKALQAGARDYVVKPFPRMRFVSAIDNALYRDRKTRSNFIK